LKLIANQLSIEFVDLNHAEIDHNLVQLLPEIYARRYRAIVLGKSIDHLLVGMADPQDINAFDAVSKILKHPIKMAVVSEFALLKVLDRVYRRTSEISHFAHELSEEIFEDYKEVSDELLDESKENEEQAPVVKLLNSLFRDAIQARASDIH